MGDVIGLTEYLEAPFELFS